MSARQTPSVAKSEMRDFSDGQAVHLMTFRYCGMTDVEGGKCEFAASAIRECATGRSGHSDDRNSGIIAAARKGIPST